MRNLLSLAGVMLSLSALAVAQTNIPKVQHVIVVIQENRTVTNLFGGDSALVTAGAHLPSSGKCHGTNITLSPFRLDACFDNDHSHAKGWLSAYDLTSSTHMDGDCDVISDLESGLSPSCQSQVTSLQCPAGASQMYCTGYTTVTTAPDSTGHVIVQPYFDMTKNWGFANYMFQTNQGPSFPAHQFLFSGTSAPTTVGGTDYQWFAAENETAGNATYGCIAAANSIVWDIGPSGESESAAYLPPYGAPANTAGYPCYDHPTLSDVLDTNRISWKYYSDGGHGEAVPFSSLWTAPNAIYHICEPSLGTNNDCVGPDFTAPGGPKVVNDLQIITDLGAQQNATSADCKLPAVSWVIPDGNWSDHPGVQGHDGGPSWVSAIVNAVGGYDNVGNPLTSNCGYWANTVVLITWDDWGGFYDDTNPITAMSSSNGGSGGYNGTTNGTYYVYGFRVPLLVVSTFVKKAGYVSGAGVYPPVCPNSYCHDFGSILNFIEAAFGSGGVPLGPISASSTWPYADATVEDLGSTQNTAFSLHDFFDFTTTHAFVPITSAKYPTSCFYNLTNVKNCFPKYPAAPDSD